MNTKTTTTALTSATWEELLAEVALRIPPRDNAHFEVLGLCSRNNGGAPQVSDELHRSRADAMTYVLDVMDPEALEISKYLFQVLGRMPDSIPADADGAFELQAQIADLARAQMKEAEG